MPVYDYDLKVILPRLQGPLRELLDAEVAAGNVIMEISSKWPMKQANVWLARRFCESYESRYPTLRYRYLGDPKNWIEEYVDQERGLLVAVSASASIWPLRPEVNLPSLAAYDRSASPQHTNPMRFAKRLANSDDARHAPVARIDIASKRAFGLGLEDDAESARHVDHGRFEPIVVAREPAP